MKDFFSKSWVMIVEAVLIVAGSIGLSYAGTKTEEIQTIPAVAISVVGAVDAVFTFIAAIIKKDKKAV